MQISKNTIAALLLMSILGTVACTESQKESAEETQQEALVQLEKAKDKTAEAAENLSEKAEDLYDNAKGTASETYDEAKDKAADMLDASKAKAAELKASAAEKLKAACIATKKKTGGDPADCQ